MNKALSNIELEFTIKKLKYRVLEEYSQEMTYPISHVKKSAVY